MFKLGTSLGYYKPTENGSAVYTLANKVPYFNNEFNDNEDTNYVQSGAAISFKEAACIYYEQAVNPGVLLPAQWADIDPNRAPASVKGTDANWATTAWDNYVKELVTLNGGDGVTNRAEKDKNQSSINVNRENLGNLGQNKAGEWTFFEEGGKYYRYKTEGGSKDAAVEITKEEYDTALAALAELEKGEGLGIWLWVIIGGSAVVVLGGAAVVLIIILKKKNKNVAADDVAGFVEIIDEGDVAPAEEAVAPEATEEEKTEE